MEGTWNRDWTPGYKGIRHQRTREAPKQRRRFRRKGWNLGARDLVKMLLRAQVKAHPSALISPVKIYSFLKILREGSVGGRETGWRII
jgi:hypothetical protein